MQELMVDLGERTYPIYIGSDLLEQDFVSKHLLPFIHGRQVAIVTNETIAPLYLKRLTRLLGSLDIISIVLPDGEAYKKLSVLETVFERLLESRHNRKTTLIALGGGVIGDMTGFAAAAYQRGVDFIQIPTTLLSQVDSSVGGKTGVNHALGKNMIGAFHQPNVVLIDINTLNTLPDREFSAGMAEVIKYGLICDQAFYQWLSNNMDALMARDPKALSYAIHRSCENKARIVAMDEKEGGIRAIFNLGHTFGHAIETHMGYGKWLHGEAVAAGMVLALKLSAKMGNTLDESVTHLTALLDKAKLPISPPAEMSPEDFMSLMSVDKKVVNGCLRLVLLRAIGEAYVTEAFSHELLKDVLEGH